MTRQTATSLLELNMVEVPAGSISLRDDRIDRKWQVVLPAFLMGRHAVTQGEYFAVTGRRPSARVASMNPVETVSWFDAVLFCNALSRAHGIPESYNVELDGMTALLVPGSDGFRLPSEAEWEYACRAGTQGARYGPLSEIGWYAGNSEGRPHEVGQKTPNAWGLYDMLGNVWEWCFDQYDPKVYGSYRVFRGGGWSDTERGCLATNRRRSHPTFAIDDLGFRVARSL